MKKKQKVTQRVKKKSYKKNSKIILKSFFWDWKKLLMYAEVFAVLKVFGLRDDVLELVKVKRWKRGWLGLCKILIKFVLLRQAIKSYREGSSKILRCSLQL